MIASVLPNSVIRGDRIPAGYRVTVITVLRQAAPQTIAGSATFG